jgi:pimeloyl-ACP methyl ester carboxylesterase
VVIDCGLITTLYKIDVPTDDERLLAELVAGGAVVDGDLVAVGERWAIHATIAYGGEVLVAEYDTVEQACAALAGTPPNPSDREPASDQTAAKATMRAPATKPPVIFVHGLWLHATSWTPWIERFAAAGYDATATQWPGEAATVEDTRADPDAQGAHSIEDVIEQHAALIGEVGRPPILIGHSLGATVVERLLTSGLGVAGIAIDAPPFSAVPPVLIGALHPAVPALEIPTNTHRTVSLTAEQFRDGFGSAISEGESNQLWERWTIPSPGNFQTTAGPLSPQARAAVDIRNNNPGPLLVIVGSNDHTVPEPDTEPTLKHYKPAVASTEVLEFPDRGRSLVIDHGWTDLADACLAWLHGQVARDW